MTENVQGPLGPAGYVPPPADPPVRLLDPSRVRRRPSDHPVGSTWYVADRLLVHGTMPEHVRARLSGRRRRGDGSALLDLERPAGEATATRLEAEAWRQGCAVAFEARLRDDDEIDEEAGYVLRLVPHGAGVEPDAWEALEADRRDDATAWALSLDHVMAAMPFTSHPFTSHPFTSHPFTSHPVEAMAQYAVPGSGGRTPVHRFGPPPTVDVDPDDVLLTRTGARRPVVAVVDTGVGTHPWFGEYSLEPGANDGRNVVLRDAVLPDGPIGTQPTPASPQADPEIGGTSVAPLTGPLDPVAGHGTFIAGIVHQVCPDALILPVRAVGGSGLALESEVIESLRRLARFHERALAGEPDAVAVDVVVLALGYYHEQPADLRWDHPLATVLARLREAGVAVVVAAGNDGETRPEYPAAFAPGVVRGDGVTRIVDPKDVSAARPPIMTVGATNPDGSTALFSNDGPWVTCLRMGANVVSAVPLSMDGPVTPTVRMPERFGQGVRSTIDPEGFQGGFAVWSGTSFAAPVLAGELAAEILDLRRRRRDDAIDDASDDASDDATDEPSRVDDVWTAIRTVVPFAR